MAINFISLKALQEDDLQDRNHKSSSMNSNHSPPPYNNESKTSSHEKVSKNKGDGVALRFGSLQTLASRMVNKFTKSKSVLSQAEKTATRDPQWRWTNIQCREWVAAVMIWYCGYDEEKAWQIANKFGGFGLILFFHQVEWWKSAIGNSEAANAICALIYEASNRGGLPKGFIYNPWKNRMEAANKK